MLWFDWLMVRVYKSQQGQSLKKEPETKSTNVWHKVDNTVSLSEEKVTNMWCVGQRLSSHTHMLGVKHECVRVRSYLKPCLE